MKPAHLLPPARQVRPRTLRRQALRRMLRALRRGRGLRPLVSALVGALPLVALHPAAVAGSFPRGVVRAIAAPSPLAVPTPGTDWLQQGSATNNHTQAQTTGQMQVDQASTRAIYRWSRFDIGSRASLTINTPSGGSSLNLVSGGDVSRIFGSLTSNGEVYLINPSGIWFGQGASVNVAGLFASTLQLDAADYMAGLAGSLRSAAPTFTWQDVKDADGAVLQTFDHPSNFVHVDIGAALTTPSGGRVFLLAREATNAGRIETPGGQTVLAAGREVYLQAPSTDTSPLYASEANAKVPATRGLLVEVGGGASGEAASNLGEILAARGNVTLVGLAVNQSGRISATTSVQENGSVFLLARSGATALNDNGGVIKRANVGGQLTLGAGSRIDITPEASAATSTDSSAFTRSRIELSAQTIELQSGAAIRAPGAIVNARAADVPDYENAAVELPPSSTARIVLGAGSSIDVSGTTDAQVSAARNYVSTELIGQADLKDAPLQKLGPLYQKSGVVFDVREDVPILGVKAGDAANPYVQATARTASERLASGGTITLQSTGLVAAHATSVLNVSGGQVTYTGATVPSVSVLVAADGTRYTLNDAPVDLAYRSLEGYAPGSVDRFGVNAPAGANLQGRWDPGYVEGRAAGTVSVTAPVALLDGQMSAGTVTGARQAAGRDALAAAGTLSLGRTTAPGDQSAVLGSLAITAAPAATDAAAPAFWADPLAAAVTDEAGQPLASRVSAAQIRAAGFGKLNVAAEGRIEQQAGADLLLPEQSSVTLRSRLGDVALNASTVTRGGTVAVTAGYGTTAQSGPGAPAITLAAGQRIDVAGNWVNRWRDGADARAAVNGGSIALKAGGALTLGTGSVLDASGGATLAANGSTVTGTAAGSIVLESNNGSASDQALAPLTLGGELRAYGWGQGQGGSLRVKAGEVLVQAGDAAPRSDGATLVLGDRFFEQGGFATYDIEGVRSLTVADGATIAPRTAAWLGRAGLRNEASGTDMARVLATGLPLDGRLSPIKLTLQSRGSSNITTQQGEGALRLAAGARIQADPRSTITLVGGNSLVVEGDIASAGGSVSLSLAGRNATANEPFAGTLRVAGTAEIDVSGTTLITPDRDRYNQGEVLAGGSITVSTTTGDGAAGTRTLIDIEDGAALRANGAAGVLDVPRAVGATGPALARNQMVASDGGRISINSREGGAYLGGTLEARAGQIQAADGRTVRGEGGTLAVGITGSSRDSASGIVGAVPEVAVVLQQAAPTRADIAEGRVTVSADRLRAGGFADVHLASADRIVLLGDVSYATSGTLSLDAPVLTARQALQAGQAAQRVNLSAATALRLGSSTRIGTSQPLPDSGPTAGMAQLAFSGGLMELFGDLVVQGARQIGLAGGSELRLRGVALSEDGRITQAGSLRAAADVTFRAPQVAPTTATRYTVDLTGEDGTAQHKLLITGGDAASAAPLSAAAVFTAKAADIELNSGVIRAPFGQVDLQATRSITVQGDSLISVSGNGLAVPYGGTLDGGKSWSYNGNPIEAPLAKSVTLAAPGQTVQLLSGEVDLSGGGQMLGWEFVPGPGGSTDIFTGAGSGGGGAYAIVPGVAGYAPHDAAIAATQGSTTLGGALPLGQQITLGEGGPLPAGTYTLLPARYALLPGAFLVSPLGRTATALGATQAQPDGSYVVGAVTSRIGSSANNQVATAWSLTPSAIARRSSEVRTTDTDTYFAAQAAKAGTAAPRLARDAGALNIEALSLALESVNRFAVQDAVARGGSLNISSERIHVAGAGTPAVAGALNLSVEQLNATGAYSLMLGGRRGASTAAGTEVQVTAREVTVDTGAATALQAGDIVLAATDKVDVAAGSRLTAREQAGSAEQLALSGDGALLRVAEDVDAASVRTGAMGNTGDLSLGAGVALTGGSVTVEATNSLNLDPSAGFSADTINVGARRIDVAPAAGGAGAGVQAGTANLAAQLAGARRVALRGFERITLAAGTQLGSDRLARITLDTASLRAGGEAGVGASVQAGGITLTNTTGVAPGDLRETGPGALTLQAHGQAGGDGHVQITGAQAIDGVQQVQLTAAGSVVIGKDAQLSTGGDLLLTARTLTAATGAAPTVLDAGLSSERTLPQLQAGGLLSLARPGAGAPQSAAAAAGLGAHVILAADRIEQGGTIDLPTARLELHAAGSAGGTAVLFKGEARDAQGAVVTPGSQTLLPGVVRTYDGQAVAAPAGQLIVQAASGDVVAEAGSVIDVSAAAAPASAGGGAGSVSISAPAGDVTLDGRLLATSGAGQTGGSLSVDSLRALNLAALAARLADERDAVQGIQNFGAALKLRNRSGDQTVAAGTVLQAQQIALTSDAGALTVAGTLAAGAGDGVNAGGVQLQAGGDVTLASGARVSAHAADAGQAGGTVFIGTQQGRIALHGGAVVEARGQDAADGTLKLRAPRTGSGAGSDVAVDAIAADVSGMGAIQVEAFKTYEATTINQTASVAQGTIRGGASGTVDTVAEAERFLAGSAAIVSRLTAGLAADQRAKLALRAGIDITSPGDLTLANAWNLTRFSASGGIDRAGGQPINLTLRAAGNLLIHASLSDGFKAAGATNATTARTIAANGVIVGEQGSDLRLVGGADLGSADVLATVAPGDSSAETGDVRIGRNGRATFVRTTTGSIDLAAGRDVVLDSRQAVVYSSGLPVSVDGFAGLRFANEGLSDGSVRQSPFLSGSGNVSISALRDVVGGSNGATPYLTNWWWRTLDTDGQALWYTRYDQFEQGFGSFGGGDVRVSAGRDALQVQLAAPETGLLRQDGATRLKGGDVSLNAGRQVVAGMLIAGGDEARVTAAEIVAQPSPDELTAGDALVVLHGDTAVTLQARQGLEVGRVGEAGMVNGARQGTRFSPQLVSGLASSARLAATTTSGDLIYRVARPVNIDGLGAGGNELADSAWAAAAPRATRLAAMSGDLAVFDTLTVNPATSADVQLFAQGSVALGGLSLMGGTAQRSRVTYDSWIPPSSIFGDVTRPLLSTGEVSPLRVVAQEGAITYGGDAAATFPVELAVPLRFIAAQGITGYAAITAQHQGATDLSLMQAGGDIVSANTVGASELVRLHGPGDLVVMAGGDIDLGLGAGIVAIGNQENSLLPRGSAAVHVLAGVDPRRGDYTQAAQRHFAVLAGGLTGVPDELAAQIEAARGLAVGASSDDDALLARARGLAGEAAHDAALLRAMQRELEDPALTLAQARAAFTALPATQRGLMARQVAGDLLAATWLATIPAAEQAGRVLALAAQQSGGAQRVAAVRAFVAQRTGTDPGSDAAALERFAALPVEQQILALQPVLEQVVTDAGKAAAQAQGTAKTLAYAPAYQALAAVFPQAAATADLLMGSSQIATRQGSALHVLAPRGGVNVGELTGNSKSASQLGVVTLGGTAAQPAPINMLVRDDIAVNQSRVFSVDEGDVLMWSSTGNLDAGRGAKTVTGAPAPVYSIDSTGKVQVDVSSAFSGSGIAVLDADSTLYLFAPRGEINTGDAGIQSAGAAFIDAVRVVGPSLQVAGPAVGLPAPAAIATTASSLGGLGQSATAAGQAAPSTGERGEDAPRRNLSLDFIAFGEIPAEPTAAGPAPSSPPAAGDGPREPGDDERRKKRSN
ncbi:MAG: filamentous hemagglutinin family protein [Burkholderiales bacterium]|nr:filamentous hemagglutinin family protein [Burkholderiales bacterium]